LCSDIVEAGVEEWRCSVSDRSIYTPISIFIQFSCMGVGMRAWGTI
jgi:hypothetical protein